MKAEAVSFGRGARWLLDGWRLFRVAPLAWLALVFTYWLIMSVISLVPLVGIGAAIVLIPGFSVGFMAASRDCERAGAPELRQLVAGFREGAPAQLVLGGVYLASLALLLWCTTLADDGALARWMLRGERPDEQTLRSEGFFTALLIAVAVYAPVMMLYWFAPVLAAWNRLGPAKALFFSFFACLINWRAFLGYSLAAALVTIVVPFLVLSAALALTGGKLMVGVMGLALPMVIVLLPTLFASFYASFRDVFGKIDAPLG